VKYFAGDIWLRLAGGNMTGNIVLATLVQLQGLDSGATARRLAQLYTGDQVRIGDNNLPLMLYHNGSLVEHDGAGVEVVWSGRRLRYVAKQAVETVNNSVVLQNDDELLWRMETNQEWFLQLFLRTVGPNAANLDFAFALPAGASGVYRILNNNDVAMTQLNYNDETTLPQDDTNKLTVIMGHFSTGATAGNAVLQWAQNVAQALDTQVLTRSVLIAMRVA